jgi:hypothetical protein
MPGDMAKPPSRMILKIQTIAVVGLLLIAVGGVITYGCQRKQEADRLRAMHNLYCGESTGKLLMEAPDMWVKLQTIRMAMADSSAPAGLEVLEQRTKDLGDLEQRRKVLTGYLNDIDTYCGSKVAKQWTNRIKTKYPGLTTW